MGSFIKPKICVVCGKKIIFDPYLRYGRLVKVYRKGGGFCFPQFIDTPKEMYICINCCYMKPEDTIVPLKPKLIQHIEGYEDIVEWI